MYLVRSVSTKASDEFRVDKESDEFRVDKALERRAGAAPVYRESTSTSTHQTNGSWHFVRLITSTILTHGDARPIENASEYFPLMPDMESSSSAIARNSSNKALSSGF